MIIRDWFFQLDGLNLPCQAPCTMYSVLFGHGKIPDPFYGLNERELQHLGEKACSFTAEFHVDDTLLAHEYIELTLGGIDTLCSIYLNGKRNQKSLGSCAMDGNRFPKLKYRIYQNVLL